MNFLLGCNYWASNAGTEMWRMWSPEAVERDLSILQKNGVGCLRVFPNWRDFQPIVPLCGGGGALRDYLLEGDREPENQWYLDETMLSRFGTFCDLAEKYGMKLIVGLVTGWMSGRLFVPAALFGRDIYTDPTALLFAQRLCRGIVTRFRSHPVIWAWDLGNECNCMGSAPDEETAGAWTGSIAGAIRSCDPVRPIVSGMHSLKLDRESGAWTIRGQAEFTDILTTHPYPYWVNHGSVDEFRSYRTAVQAACETKLYADISHKPCLVEEIGTMGPMICSEKAAADFLRVNVLGNLALGSPGLLWWCANDQTNLSTPPYNYQMCEVELGMIRESGEPKPVLREMGRLREAIDQIPALSPAKEDGVILLTRGQDQWAVGYMAWCVGRQAGLNLRFAWCDDPLPEAKLYLMPSVAQWSVMSRKNWLELKERVKKGAVFYISNDTGILSGFEELTGVRMEDSSFAPGAGEVTLRGLRLPYRKNHSFFPAAVGAQVLGTDEKGRPAVTENRYGDGTVYYVNFPLERMLTDENHGLDGKYYQLYEILFRSHVEIAPAASTSPFVNVTVHGDVICAVNASGENAVKALTLAGGRRIAEIYYGDPENIPPFDGAVFRVE